MSVSEGSLPIAERDGGVTVSITADHAALVNDPLPSVIRRVAVPAVASNLLMTVFLAADAFWIGRRLGPTALAAATSAVFWVWLGISVAEMVSVGLTAVAARRHGERRRDEAARVAGEALVLALALGTIAGALAHANLPRMFGAMDARPDVARLGMQYLGMYAFGAPLLYGYFAVDATFRAAGDTRTPFLILLASVLVGLALDPLLILGAGPFPALGVRGAAVATIGTRAAAFIVGLALLRRRGMLRFAAPRPAVLARIARVGLPTAATGVLFSAVYVVIGRTASHLGTPVLAALGVGFRIESWLYMLGVGFGAAAAAVVGQNLGAGQVARAERAGWTMLAYASVPALFVSAAQFLAPAWLTSTFSTDPAVIAEASSYLRLAALSQLVVCGEVVLEGAMGGAGATLLPMLTSTTLTLSRVPLAVWASARWGVDGLWWTIVLTATARGVAMMALWRWGRWKRNVV